MKRKKSTPGSLSFILMLFFLILILQKEFTCSFVFTLDFHTNFLHYMSGFMHSPKEIFLLSCYLFLLWPKEFISFSRETSSTKNFLWVLCLFVFERDNAKFLFFLLHSFLSCTPLQFCSLSLRIHYEGRSDSSNGWGWEKQRKRRRWRRRIQEKENLFCSWRRKE